MKDSLFYNAIILIPFIPVFLIFLFGSADHALFAFGVFYIYKVYIDWLRLKAVGQSISKPLLLGIPFYRWQYLPALHFGRVKNRS